MASENRERRVGKKLCRTGTGGGGTVLLSKKERGRTASLSLGLHGVPGRPSLASSGRKQDVCTCTCIYIYIHVLVTVNDTYSSRLTWHDLLPEEEIWVKLGGDKREVPA